MLGPTVLGPLHHAVTIISTQGIVVGCRSLMIVLGSVPQKPINQLSRELVIN